MRVGVDATALEDLHSGAARRIVDLWSRVLDQAQRNPGRLDLKVVIVTAPRLQELMAERMPRAKVVAVEPARGPVDRWLRTRGLLRGVIRDEKLDYFFQDPRPLAWPRKTLPTIHDLRALDDRFAGLSRRLYSRWWAGRELRACPRVLAVSRHVARELRRRYRLSADKVVIIRNGVERHQFELDRPLPVELEPVLGDRPFLLVVGHREARKNLPFSIRLVPLLKEAGWSHRLAIVGRKVRGYDEPERLVAELGLEEDVVFLGGVPEESLCALYRQARAFLFPSLLEGFGIPLLEAMSASCPALVSDQPPFDEIAPENSRLPLDPAAWVSTLTRLESDEGFRDDLVEAGRIRAASYDWDGPASLMIDLLADLPAAKRT